LANYTFARDGDKIVVDVELKWKVYNYGSSSLPYASLMAINLSDCPSQDHVQCEVVGGGRDHVYTAKELNEKHLEEEGTRIIYRIPPRRLGWQDIEDRRTEAACKVTWRYRIIKHLRDVELIHSPLPTIGMTIRIQCNCGLRFEFDPDDGDHVQGSSEWRFKLFMPQQQLQLRWCSEAEDANPS